MKITKGQLKQIIREEISALNEYLLEANSLPNRLPPGWKKNASGTEYTHTKYGTVYLDKQTRKWFHKNTNGKQTHPSPGFDYVAAAILSGMIDKDGILKGKSERFA